MRPILFLAMWMIAWWLERAGGPVVHEHHAVERGAAQRARRDRHGRGDLDVKSGAATLFEGDFASRSASARAT